ncbi:MAG: N-acetyltransferase family protein [Planctomycetota bacterium]
MVDSQIRHAQTSDAASIASIYNQYVGEGPYTMDQTPWTESLVTQRIHDSDPRQVCGVVTCGEEVAGWGALRRFSDREGYWICCEISLYFDRRRTGQGMGHDLMEWLIDQAEHHGYQHIVSRIVSTNESSLRFHYRHGFELVGVQRDVGLIAGKLTDVTILQRLLRRRDEFAPE